MYEYSFETVNKKILPNSLARIIIDRLKFDAEDTGQGIFFTDTKGKATKASLIIQNQPSRLIFMVPALAKGTYKVQVRSILNGTEVREGSLYTSRSVE